MRKFNLKLCTFIFSVVLLGTSCQEKKLELLDSYTDNNFFPKSIIALEDGGCIVATGYENIIRLNDNTTDDSSKVIWSRTIPSLRIQSIVSDKKDFVVVGEQQIVETDTLKDKTKVTAEYLKCAKLSKDGNILWEVRDEMMTNVNVRGAVDLENGAFGVFGIVNSVSTDTLDYLNPFVVKINSQGEVIWRKIFNEKRSNNVKVIKDSEGLMTVIFSSIENADLYLNFQKIDNAGNNIWTKTHDIKSIYGEEIQNFQFLISLEMSAISSTDEACTLILEHYRDLFAMKFDKNGEVLWNKKLDWGKFLATEDLEQINDDLFVATTTIGGLGEKEYNYFNLVGLNKDMEVLWNYKSEVDFKNYGYAISKGFNDDIYVTIGNDYEDKLLSNSIRDDNFSKRSKNRYKTIPVPNLIINHFKIK